MGNHGPVLAPYIHDWFYENWYDPWPKLVSHYLHYLLLLSFVKLNHLHHKQQCLFAYIQGLGKSALVTLLTKLMRVEAILKRCMECPVVCLSLTEQPYSSSTVKILWSGTSHWGLRANKRIFIQPCCAVCFVTVNRMLCLWLCHVGSAPSR